MLMRTDMPLAETKLPGWQVVHTDDTATLANRASAIWRCKAATFRTLSRVRERVARMAVREF
jgi:hypothetical protein